jgi:hypothetical protein
MELAFEKQKTENERLKLQLKELELQQELVKISIREDH